MEYKFTQEWTKEDYIAFAMNHMKVSVFKPSNIILFTISIGYLTITPLVTGGDYTFFYLGLGVIIFLGAFLLFTRVGAGRAYEKNKDLMKINFLINENGLTYLNSNGELLKPWNEFYSFKETKDYFFMHFSKYKGMLLAKRELSDELQKYIIKNVTEHLVNKKKIKLLKDETDKF
ncbi:MAG: YcxB family protein [Candidatus Izimaplasma sp.]|nr:YcxB family protein [Candidatus Izimaplasma bacterium]